MSAKGAFAGVKAFFITKDFLAIAVPTLAFFMAARVVATADDEAAGRAAGAYGTAATGAATGAAAWVWAAAASFC